MENKLLFIFFSLLVFSHFLFLDRFPAGFNHDEIEKIASIVSFQKFGKDISGVPFPQALVATRTPAGQNNLPSILLALFFDIVPLTTTTIRLSFVLINLATCFLLSYLVWKMTNNKVFSAFSLFVSLVNPWMWFLSRSIAEAPFALFFLILGMVCLESGRKVLFYFSFIPFLFAMLSYWGVSPIIPIVVSGIFLTNYFNKNSQVKNIFRPLVAFALLFLVFVVAIFTTKDSTFLKRNGELLFSNLQRYTPEVNSLRTESIGSPFGQIFINKDTLLLRDLSSKYLSVWSPNYLFFIGDPRATYRFGEHGMLYLFDAPLLVLGVIFTISVGKSIKSRRLLYYILILAVISPIPSGIENVETSYVFRSVYLLPVITIIIASGFTFLWRYSRVLVAVSLSTYLLFFAAFLFFYFLRYSVAHQENQFWGEDIVSTYLGHLSDKTSAVVVTNYPTQLALKYLFENNLPLTADTFDSLYAKNLKINNIVFTSNCPAFVDLTIVQEGSNCKSHLDKPKIVEDMRDSGGLWKIYNDSLCNEVSLDSYRATHFLSDYDIYHQSLIVFCKRQIFQYK